MAAEIHCGTHLPLSASSFVLSFPLHPAPPPAAAAAGVAAAVPIQQPPLPVTQENMIKKAPQAEKQKRFRPATGGGSGGASAGGGGGGSKRRRKDQDSGEMSPTSAGGRGAAPPASSPAPPAPPEWLPVCTAGAGPESPLDNLAAEVLAGAFGNNGMGEENRPDAGASTGGGGGETEPASEDEKNALQVRGEGRGSACLNRPLRFTACMFLLLPAFASLPYCRPFVLPPLPLLRERPPRSHFHFHFHCCR